eukprot:11467321-Alexandrium_andersonii.AAC.1
MMGLGGALAVLVEFRCASLSRVAAHSSLKLASRHRSACLHSRQVSIHREHHRLVVVVVDLPASLGEVRKAH